ncbi:tRNA (adenine(58)-N(1))-methyltransferase non-catalytic subunit TRM6 [Lutzomyia longipalpis]|uniref:tRNA (adenine(58)-N(1))-methyltransferase non-catalytic subunit TRM6 n=1 Tax=Lutzomyia longipalpis TaxID=7200 RepID=UPI002483BDB2|nr:tRNA (adenine(58)-N(1))-methyltransferase non-catalytic subunit TRM6 [Lutzomyia longipalpis]
MCEENIKFGDYIIIQRQKYSKLYKFTEKTASVTLGKQKIDLSTIEGHPYYATFRMVPQSGDKTFKLEHCINPQDIKEAIAIDKSGKDNRDIFDDGRSQGLTEEEIKNLRDTCETSTEIVEHLVDNSKTFASKTEYAQEKYLRRKEKKYYEYVQIRKPTLRLIFDIYFRKDPEKLLNMRMDTLSQIISYSGVCSSGKYLVYESGTNGICLAAFLNATGDCGDAHVVSVHPGNFPNKQAVMAMNFPPSYEEKFTTVNLYSVLRHYYQKDPAAKEIAAEQDTTADDEGKEMAPTNNVEEPLPKKRKVEAEEKKQWQLDNAKACSIIRNKVDSLTIVAKEHPTTIFRELVHFVRPGRPFIIYSPYREILIECFNDLKGTPSVLGLRIYSNVLRMYQVLTDRTHPDMMMSGNSGFLLCGYTINRDGE